MERTLVKFLAQPQERYRFIEMLFYVAANFLHHFDLGIAANRRGTAAQAGAVSGVLGFERGAKEANVFAPGTPRRAGRAAVNSSRRNGKDEAVVKVGVTVDDRLPAPLVGVLGHVENV
jgi:hypothetical protein